MFECLREIISDVVSCTFDDCSNSLEVIRRGITNRYRVPVNLHLDVVLVPSRTDVNVSEKKEVGSVSILLITTSTLNFCVKLISTDWHGSIY